MANFATHTGVAATLGSSLVTLLVVTTDLSLLTGIGLLIFFIAGTLLPDIDVDNAKPVRWLFHIFALLAMLLAIFITQPSPATGLFSKTTAPVYPNIQTLIAAILAWLLVRYPLAWMFQRFTRHRGLAHSLIIGLAWALGWVYFGLNLLAINELFVWLQGVALFLGFLLHLLLDEVYSVDLERIRIKRSFGTALKVYQKDFISGSLAAFLGVVLLVWLLPWPKVLIDWVQTWLG